MTAETWNNLREQFTALAMLAVPTAVAVVVVARQGWARRSALAAGPRRDAGLNVLDLAVALVVPALAILETISALVRGTATTPTPHTAPLAPPPLDAMNQLVTVLRAQLVTQLPFVLWLVVRSSRVPERWRRVGLASSDAGRSVGVGAAALLIALPLVLSTNGVMALLGTLLGYPTPELGHDLLRVMRDSDSALATAGLIVAAVVVAPLLEECIFRGLLQTSLLSVLGGGRRWTAALLTAGLFALVHASAAWQVLPGLFVLGVVLGWLYERRGSLWPSIVLHALFNAFNVAFVMLFMNPTG